MKQTFYLNKSGSKWFNVLDGKRQKVTFYPSLNEKPVERVVTYEQCGNGVVLWVNYKGKTVPLMRDTKYACPVYVINNDENRKKKYSFNSFKIV